MIVAKTSEKTNYSQYSTTGRYVTRGSFNSKEQKNNPVRPYTGGERGFCKGFYIIFILPFGVRILLFNSHPKQKPLQEQGIFRAEKEGFELYFIFIVDLSTAFKHA